MISLDTHGDISDPRFSVVWASDTFTKWSHLVYDTKANFQSFVNNWAANGYVLTLITAIGGSTDSGSRWSAYMERQSTQGIGQQAGQWFWKLDMTTGGASDKNSFEYYNQAALKNQQILTCFTTYGSGDDLVIAAAWAPNKQRSFERWHAYSTNDSDSFQSVFAAETSLPAAAEYGWRPYHLAVSSDHQYTSVFGDGFIGPWTTIHHRTNQEFTTELGTQAAQGKNPIHIKAGGSGTDIRYAAIFAENVDDYPKYNFEDGSSTVFRSTTALDPVLGELEDFLLNNTIEAGQIAVFKNGIVRLQHGADWQVSVTGVRQTSLTDLFPIAGLSEIFLSAAISKLYDSGKLSPNSTAYSFFSNLQGPKDRRADSITVQQLLDHISGYAPDLEGNDYDPVFSMREIAQALGLTSQIQKRDIVEYVYTQRVLEADPGSDYHDANYNYLLLSAIIEQVTKQDYLTWLTANIIQPAGLGITGWPTQLTSAGSAGHVVPKDQGLGPSALSPNQPVSELVPYVFGGDGMIREVAVGCLGLAGSASYLASFIHQNAVQGYGGRAANKSRVSSVAGGLAYAESRDDGFDWAFVVNSRDWNRYGGNKPYEALVRNVNAILDALPPGF
ncbi:MAG: hypothetical protein Q9225_000300 [Loekoesia sp. 1 TL-2023]